MNPRYVVYAAVILASFGAGWATNGWRKDNEIAVEKHNALRDDVADRDAVIEQTNAKLYEVLAAVTNAATQANSTANQLQALNTEHMATVEGINRRTQRLNNEIGKLQTPSCVFGADVGRLYQQVGEAANAGRHTLYGPNDPATD